MWLEETISPSTSSSGWTSVTKRSSAPSSCASPCALWPKRKFSPIETRRARSAPDEHLVDELGRRALGEAGVERDHDQLLHAQRGDQLGLAIQRGQQLGRVLGGDHRHRVRVEREHAVGSIDHLAVAEVHPVEGAHGHVALVRALHVRQAGDPHGRTAYCGRARLA